MEKNKEWQMLVYRQQILGDVTTITFVKNILDISLIKFVRDVFNNTEDNNYKNLIMYSLEERERELTMLPKWNVNIYDSNLYLCDHEGKTKYYFSYTMALMKETRLMLLGYNVKLVQDEDEKPGYYKILLIEHPHIPFTKEYMERAALLN